MYSAQSGLCALSCQMRAPTRRFARTAALGSAGLRGARKFVLRLPGCWLGRPTAAYCAGLMPGLAGPFGLAAPSQDLGLPNAVNKSMIPRSGPLSG
jgi:hypothetical protein